MVWNENIESILHILAGFESLQYLAIKPNITQYTK